MCIDYALGSASPHPVRAFRLQTPLMVAIGAWDRLEQRESGKVGFHGVTGFAMAKEMKRWTMAMLHRVDNLWDRNEATTGLHDFEAACAVAAGNSDDLHQVKAWRDRR